MRPQGHWGTVAVMWVTTMNVCNGNTLSEDVSDVKTSSEQAVV